eukprot:257748_1
MNMSSPKYYGSTKQKNKEEKIGGRTIIDFHSCLDVAFVCLWLFSICARPTIVSTIHLLLFGIYVIIGGIILYETTKKNKTCLINQQSPKYSKKKKKKKKKKHKVELTDLSESLISHTPPTYVDNKYMSLTSNKQISSFHDQNISHPPVRYGVDSMIMIMLSIYCTLVALIQVIIQILISANIINGNNNALNMFGFQEPKETHEWLLYLTLDLILCVITIGLAYLHKRRNDKYKWSRLNIINVEKILLSTRKSLPILESYHSKLSDILSDDDDDDDNDDYDIDIDSVASTNKSMLITGSQKQATLPIFYTFTTSCLLLLISIAAPSVLHIPYFLVVLLVCLGPIIALWKQTKSVFHMIGPIYMLLHLILISLYQVEVIQNVLNDTISDILGLENLHQSYWSYQDFIHNQHIVPNLVSTVFMVILFYCLGLRPILLHSSIYRATPSQTSIRQKSHSHSHSHSLLKKSSGGNLFLSPPPHRKRAISNKNNKSSKKSGSYQALPDIESDISSDLTSDSKDNVEKTRIKKFLPHKQEGEKEEKKHDSHPLEIINESATKIISDRRSTIMCTIFYRLSAQEDMKEEEEEDSNKNKNKNKKLSKDRPRAFSRIQPVITTKKTSRSKRAKTVSFIKGRTLDSDTDSDDETMIKIERQESLRRLRSEQLTRKKLSMASIKSSIRSIQPIDDDDDDDDNDDYDIDIDSVASTNKSMLITGSQKQATLPIFYTFTTSCLLLLISIAAPSVLHIPYFLVVLLVCLGPIIALWKQTKSVFHMIGPIYMLLHLILISLYQVEVIQNVLNDTISDILGLENLHQSYWSYQDFIHNQHIVPNLVSTVFMVILFYCLGLRPILLHSSIYRATPSQTSIRQKSHSHSHSHSLLKKSSGGNLFLSPPPHRKRAISNKNNKSSKKSGSYQALPDIESDISSDLTSDSKDNVEKTRIKKFLPHKQEGEKEEKKHDSHPLEIINESATKIISDRRSTIMCTIFYRLSAQEDMKEEEEEDSNKNKNKNKKLSKDRPRAFSRIQPVITTKKTSRSKRAKTVSFIKGRTLDSDTDSDDETMIKIERQESLRRLRSEQLTRKKLSMASIKSSIRSIQPIDDDDDDDDNDDSNIFIRKIKIAFHWIECMVEI